MLLCVVNKAKNSMKLLGSSRTLFSIYINALVDDINQLNCGIDAGDTHISLFLYADDIVLLAENA